MRGNRRRREEDAMLRRIVLAVAGLSMTTVAFASEVPVSELPSTPFVGGSEAAAPARVPAASPAPAASLVWLDPASAALGTDAMVRPEVTRLLRAMGVTASWRRGEPQELARPGELRIIFLDRAAQREHGVPVLGATPSSFQGERFVWVHVPSVRAAAGVSSQTTAPSLDLPSTRRLGLALARVIAHEVVHALAPELPHGRGLMSARLDHGMLTAASIAIDPQVGVAVRAALAGAPPAGRPADTILAVESTYREPYR
jgi:hypothetical protein